MDPGTGERWRAGRRALVCAVLAACFAASTATAATPVLIDVAPVKVIPKKRMAILLVTTAGDLAKPAQCALDARAFVPCEPRMVFRGLRKGRHTFRVEATPADGSPISALSKVFFLRAAKKKSKVGRATK
jgi:hypothetical protein